MKTISTEIRDLLTAQKEEWELAGKNFADLGNVQVREFHFNGFTIKVQFNPGRIISSAAKVDKKSIEARRCFLCEANRPEQQRSVQFNDYSVLINPFPIFPEHFTVPDSAHIPQRIKASFGNMLELAEAMTGFTLFYNGPKCGASAPDHFHFQAGNTGFMPIDNEIDFLKKQYGSKLETGDVEFYAVKDGLRNFLVLESKDKRLLCDRFKKIYQAMNTLSGNKEEPMMNILALVKEGSWRISVFPRAKHRPWQYTAKGDENILLSPASVDMGGILITPLEKDYEKIRKKDIEDIMRQVLLSDEEFDKLVNKIEN